MKYYRIGIIAKELDVSTETIRQWTKRHKVKFKMLLGWRHYSETGREKLHQIKKMVHVDRLTHEGAVRQCAVPTGKRRMYQWRDDGNLRSCSAVGDGRESGYCEPIGELRGEEARRGTVEVDSQGPGQKDYGNVRNGTD